MISSTTRTAPGALPAQHPGVALAEVRGHELVDAAPDAMVIVDLAGTIVIVNAQTERLFGYAREELLGRPIETLLPARFRAAHPAHRAEFLTDRAHRRMGAGRELFARRADGSEFPVEVTLGRLETADGILVTSAVRDITEDRRQRQRLEHANQQLSELNAAMEEFVYVASHDLKAPLQAIEHLVDWIAEDLGAAPPGDVGRNLARLRERTVRLKRLIEDLLEYSRATRGIHAVEDVALPALVEDIAEMLGLRARFELVTRYEIEVLHTERTPLETVLRNLLSNAVKHHDGERGVVTLAVERDGGFARITVADDGPGIDAQHHERVFKLFQTLEAAGRDGGSGIGLTIVRRLVEQLGGRVGLHSAPGARGCRFEFTWPTTSPQDVI